MAKSLKDRISDFLINSKLVKKEDLGKAQGIHKEKGGNLGKILVQLGLVSERDLVAILSEELNIPSMNLSKYKVTPEIVSLIPQQIACRYNLIPISKIGNTLTIAMEDPLNIFAIDDIKALTNFNIDIILSSSKEILEAIDNYYEPACEEVLEVIEEDAGRDVELELLEEEKIDIEQVVQESQTAPTVKMVHLILIEALKKRASDIHIEPLEKSLRVRYRIDGNLQEALKIPKKNQNAVLARLKIMSGLDITESRMPQDGRFKIRLENREIDFRVSVLPIVFGGKVVLRALDRLNLSVGLDKLGFLPEPLNAFKEAIAKPFGMILVTGPTGSGKSTTLYSIINQLNKADSNIITVEDPVEYQLEGITQIQANPEIGLTFASGLRSLLRQSPDIIMIGEIRDSETADIAIKAALTGQLLFSTLHTNDAAGSITRLVDMKVEPFLIASSLILVAAQRLCRRVCRYCKEPYKVPYTVLEKAGLKLSKAETEKMTFYKGKGCSRCNQTGYLGRMGILETLVIDDEVREMIVSRASSSEIKNYAVKKGMLTLRDNGLRNFARGETTLEEVLRVTSEE